MRQEWLALLVCPVTRTLLRWDEERQELVSEAAGLAFPVREGVPVMLVEAARTLPPQRQLGRGASEAGGGVTGR